MNWLEFDEEIKSRVNWKDFYLELGIETNGDPGESGWLSCKSPFREDRNPSCCVNVKTGWFKDHSTGESIGPWDFMVKMRSAVNWREARKKVALKLGIEIPGEKKSDPDYKVNWMSWSDSQAQQFCDRKPPCSIEGLKLAHARICNRFGISAIALPIFGMELKEIGWLYLPRVENGFVVNDNQVKSISKKYKGSEGGLVGNVDKITSGCRVIWCEGPTDMLALLSRFPSEVVVSNSNGCQENVTETQKMLISPARDVIIMSDCDKPGIQGAIKKMVSLGKKAIARRPGYEVSENHGKDLRDLLNESDVKTLEELISPAYTVEIEVNKEDGAKPTETSLLEKMKLHIISTTDKGYPKIFCSETGMSMTLNSIYNTSYDRFTAIFGDKFCNIVSDSGDEGVISFKKFKQVLFSESSKRSPSMRSVGAGVWKHDNGLLLVKRGFALSFENGNFIDVSYGVVDDVIPDISTDIDWFDYNKLKDYIDRARDAKWRVEAWNELKGRISQWPWKEKYMADIACGMYAVSYIQSALKGRPTVIVEGESNSGKSLLSQEIENMLNGLGLNYARPTSAGIEKKIGNSSSVVITDEFDCTKQREWYESRRLAYRGQKRIMATTHHTSVEFRNDYIAWLIGIHPGSGDRADLNRAISLSLVKPKDNGYPINPDPSEFKIQSVDIGHKILACVLVTHKEILENVERLSRLCVIDIDSRFVESYSIPFSIIGTIVGMELDECARNMTHYIGGVSDKIGIESSPEHEELLIDIMGRTIRVSTGMSVSPASILFGNKSEYIDELEGFGIAVVMSRKTGKKKIAIDIKKVKRDLLKTDIGVTTILSRLEGVGVKYESQLINGMTVKCITMDFDSTKSLLGSKESIKRLFEL